MRASLPIFVAVVLVASLVLSPAAGQAVSADHLLLTEVMYDPAAPEPGAEWIEVFAPGGVNVSLSGWHLRDNNAEDALPDVQINPGEYVVIASDEAAFRQSYPGFSGKLINLGSPIGNGLANGGDRVLLVDPSGATMDAMSYGSDTAAMNPPCPDVPEGEALARFPSETDTDSASDWLREPTASPGGPAAPPVEPTATPSTTPSPTATRTSSPSPTATRTSSPSATPGMPPTSTATPTASPGPTAGASATPTVKAAATATATASSTPAPNSWPAVLLTEVMYDPLQEGTDSSWEWVEIRSMAEAPVQLAGWQVADSNSRDTLPDVELAPGEFLVIAANGAAFRESYPAFAGRLISLDGPIGNGLSNTGDSVRLLAPDATAIDALSYGSDESVFDPACPDVPAGQSLARVPDTQDTGAAADWVRQTTPNPGEPGTAPTPTPTATLTATVVPTDTAAPTPTLTVGPTRTATPTGTPTPTRTRTALPTKTRTPTVTRSATPTQTSTLGATRTPSPTATPVVYAKVLITEVLYDARHEGSEGAYEWIEVYAPGPGVDLAGWRLEDNTSADVLPSAVVLPGGYLVIAATRDGFLAEYPGYVGPLASLEGTIGNGLSNGGDRLRLTAPDGTVIDSMSYGSDREIFDPPCPGVAPGESLARVPSDRDTDTAAEWHRQATANPGAAGVPVTPTPSPTPSPTATATWEQTPTATPTPSPAPSATPTATPTTGQYDGTAIRLNEIMPAPSAVDWDGSGEADSHDEYIELYNRTDQALALNGWGLDDLEDAGSRPYVFPATATIGPHAYLVVFPRESGIALNNDGDAVRLLGPDGVLLDSYTYAGSKPDRSFSLTEAGVWTDAYAPSPGAENRAPDPTATPTPTATATSIPGGVRLNELLPNPQSVDWDGDGQASWRDEWVELYNLSEEAAALGGWRLLDATGTYTIPQGTVIWPHSHLLLFRQQTGLSLSDWRDSVALVRPDGLSGDQFSYDGGVGADRSLCRASDGAGAWTRDCEVTPGGANRLLPPPPLAAPQPTATPRVNLKTLADARRAPNDTRVTVTGTVVLPAGLFARALYIQDGTAGLKLYLRSGDFPSLAVGDRVQATGWTRTYEGEPEVSIPDPSYVARLGAGVAPAAVFLRTGAADLARSGQLVSVAGKVLRYERQGLILDDGSGPLRIYFPEGLGWQRPYVQLGQAWAAQGVLVRNPFGDALTGMVELVPRFKTDVGRAPLTMPVTGGGD